MNRNPLENLGHGLGDYLREQRESARLSVRQLSELSGISNPYLSQIERGLKKPSAEILGRLAKGLEVSAESLYIRAGLLEPDQDEASDDTRRAIGADSRLTSRQKATLLEIYDSFVGDDAGAAAEKAARKTADRKATRAAGAESAPQGARKRTPATPRKTTPTDQTD